MTSVSPRVILGRMIMEFVGQLPGIRDGHPESVHAARVATRRLREIIPLLAASYPQEGGAFEALIRSAGRALGRVRELDVMRIHLSRLEERLPETAVGATVARRTLCARLLPAAGWRQVAVRPRSQEIAHPCHLIGEAARIGRVDEIGLCSKENLTGRIRRGANLNRLVRLSELGQDRVVQECGADHAIVQTKCQHDLRSCLVQRESALWRVCVGSRGSTVVN